MVVNAKRWTVKDIDTLPDDGGWTHYEVIDGELFTSTHPHAFHQMAVGSLCI